MRRNGSRHFELRATPQMGPRCGFQDQNRVLSRDGTNNLTTNGDHNRPPPKKKRIHTDLYL